MTEDRFRRREVIRSAGYVAVGISCTLAGCPDPGRTVLSDSDEEGASGGTVTGPSGNNNSSSTTQSNETTGTGGTTPTETEADANPLTAAPKYGDWFEGVSNYNSLTRTYTQDTETAQVTVGASGNGGFRAFEHPAITIPTGATVEWEWSGEGGEHNVVAENGTFDSGEPTSEPDTTFSYEFTSTGQHLYACDTHRDEGMKGSVSVYEPNE